MITAEWSTAVEFDGEILEFVGKTKEDSRRRAEKFVKRHASARIVEPAWDGVDIEWGEE